MNKSSENWLHSKTKANVWIDKLIHWIALSTIFFRSLKSRKRRELWSFCDRSGFVFEFFFKKDGLFFVVHQTTTKKMPTQTINWLVGFIFSIGIQKQFCWMCRMNTQYLESGKKVALIRESNWVFALCVFTIFFPAM